MTRSNQNPFQPDPQLDLVLERVVDVAPALVWRAWTEPELIKQWFTPAPWQTTDCEIDLRPGGLFRTVMRSPEGSEETQISCILEVIAGERLVWTDALGPGYRPNASSFLTAVIALEPHGEGTKYTAIAIHKDQATRKSHEEMGFFNGWGTALDQLVALMKTL